MDGLPVREETGLEYASDAVATDARRAGPGHAGVVLGGE
jgi:hypothetical protein